MNGYVSKNCRTQACHRERLPVIFPLLQHNPSLPIDIDRFTLDFLGIDVLLQVWRSYDQDQLLLKKVTSAMATTGWGYDSVFVRIQPVCVPVPSLCFCCASLIVDELFVFDKHIPSDNLFDPSLLGMILKLPMTGHTPITLSLILDAFLLGVF